MKYYKSDLWLKIQNIETRNAAERQWIENDKIYEREFQKIREQLPRTFVKAFDNECGFHDFIIDEIIVKNVFRKTTTNSINVLLKIGNNNKCYIIELKDVETSKINIVGKTYCICGEMSWGYSEFEILPDKKIKLSILCDVVNELEFLFKKISIKRCNNV